MIGQLRRSGLDAIGELPWGTHFCQFYQTGQDLLEVLVGYFRPFVCTVNTRMRLLVCSST